MNRAKFTCEVITPMFMAGADSRTPELRPSEFKGMMRFWWRAMKADDNIKNLKKKEADLFGSTEKGKSKISIKIRHNSDIKKYKGNNLRYEIRNNYPGLSYLFYSTFTLRSRGNPIIREYIKSGYEFEVILISFSQKEIREAIASFWLSVFLGGFGTRARRGGGNISVNKIEGDAYNINFLINNITTKERLKEWFNNNIEKVKKIIPIGKTNKYSNLRNARIIIFNPKQSWKNALNFLGLRFKDFRVRNKSYIWNMAAFGMPVMHNRFRVRMVPYKNQRRLSERRASSLIIKVIKSGNLYFPTIIKLSGDMGSAGKEQKVNRKWVEANKDDIKQVNFGKIEEFLNSFNDKVEILI